MIDDRPLSPDRVPTLTEVVELDLPPRPPVQVGARGDAASAHGAQTADHPVATPPDALASVDAPEPWAEARAEAALPAMADDFMLAGLDTQGAGADVEAPGESGPDDGAADDVRAPESVVDLEAGDETEPAMAEATASSEALHEAMHEAMHEALHEALPIDAVDAAGPATAGSGGPVDNIAMPTSSEAAPTVVPAPIDAAAPAVPSAVDVDAVVGQVLSELMPRIDMLLESRLREALAPALARAADGLIRDTRAHLSPAMRDLVQEAVDRALQRRADR